MVSMGRGCTVMWSVLHESPSLFRHKGDKGIAERFIIISSERHGGPATSIHCHRPHTCRKTPPRVCHNSLSAAASTTFVFRNSESLSARGLTSLHHCEICPVSGAACFMK